jgi:hypothetical protein
MRKDEDEIVHATRKFIKEYHTHAGNQNSKLTADESESQLL